MSPYSCCRLAHEQNATPCCESFKNTHKGLWGDRNALGEDEQRPVCGELVRLKYIEETWINQRDRCPEGYWFVTLYSRYMSKESNSNPAKTATTMIHTGTKNRLSAVFHTTAVTTWATGNHTFHTSFCTFVPPSQTLHIEELLIRVCSCLFGFPRFGFWRDGIRHLVHFVLNRALQNVLVLPIGILWPNMWSTFVTMGDWYGYTHYY